MKMMKAFKRAAALLMACALLALCGGALAEDARVFDRADLFSASEEAEISKAIAAFQEDTGLDFVVLTAENAEDDSEQHSIADHFYNEGHFGLDDENSGVLYYIDMEVRNDCTSTTGKGIDYLTDARHENLFEQTSPHLRRGDYAGAALAAIQAVRKYVKDGIPEGQYRYDVLTGKRLTARHKALTSGELLLGALVAAVVWLVFVFTVRSRYKLKGSTYSYDYQDNAKAKLTVVNDEYLRTTVTRAPKSPPPSSGGGGFGGGSGSGVHSSGGVSHGGGSGKGF